MLGIILCRRGPPRRKFGLLDEMLWWIPQVKPCRRARKAEPIHAPRSSAALSIMFPLFLPFHSQSLMTSVLWRSQPPRLPSSDVEYAGKRLPFFGGEGGELENKSHRQTRPSDYACMVLIHVNTARRHEGA